LEPALDVGWVKQERNPPQTKLLVGCGAKKGASTHPTKKDQQSIRHLARWAVTTETAHGAQTSPHKYRSDGQGHFDPWIASTSIRAYPCLSSGLAGLVFGACRDQQEELRLIDIFF
jgi:hypothetical protein